MLSKIWGGIMKKIDVYDFDGTIYDGDSTVDFFFYCLKRNKRIIPFCFNILGNGILMVGHVINLTEFKGRFLGFVKYINNIDDYLDGFWKENEHKICKYFLDNMKEKRQTFIISASPEFIIKPFSSKFDNVTLIGTLADKKTGKIKGINCKGEEKIKRLNKVISNYKIERFYSDSKADLPLVRISEKAYLVQHGKLSKFD